MLHNDLKSAFDTFTWVLYVIEYFNTIKAFTKLASDKFFLGFKTEPKSTDIVLKY